ncbi:enoyl-CoA hydratase [Erythrobacter sp. YT30]|nr:enoyl-CoA hydratase [Erythrobacter sp. YT30]
MFNTNTGFNFASAAMAVIVSASFFAYAIVPASPALIA